jgi:hypothetical protein
MVKCNTSGASRPAPVNLPLPALPLDLGPFMRKRRYQVNMRRMVAQVAGCSITAETWRPVGSALASMTYNISLPDLPSWRTLLIRANWFAGIHLLWSARISFFHRYKIVQWVPVLLVSEDLYPPLPGARPCMSVIQSLQQCFSDICKKEYANFGCHLIREIIELPSG